MRMLGADDRAQMLTLRVLCCGRLIRPHTKGDEKNVIRSCHIVAGNAVLCSETIAHYARSLVVKQ